MYRPAITLFALAFYFTSYCQPDTYILNGAAQRNSCNCYTLTPDISNQGGSVWNKNLISLTDPFDFKFNVNLGCKDGFGADGIVFILQTEPTSLGTYGSGMGFAGVSPSIGIALDTYQNIDPTIAANDLNDPDYDHISIQANGIVKHGNDLAGPVPASATSDNIEDCQWHILQITWDPAAHWLRSYFDGVLRVQAQVDLTNTIFNNNAKVYWGFAGATGGLSNVQQFCTALNPKYTTNLPNNTACENATVQFTDQSESFAPIATYYWNFGDGSISNSSNPSLHNYSRPGIYNVQMAITGKDGCNSDTLKTSIAIGTKPVADFAIYDTCVQASPRIADKTISSIGAIKAWNWTVNTTDSYTDPLPQLKNLSAGLQHLQLVATSEYGCVSDPVTKSFTIKERPQISAAISNICQNTPAPFSTLQTDTKTTVSQWYWNFGDSSITTGADVMHSYKRADNYTVQTWVLATNGCSSDTASKIITVYPSFAFAGNDTIVLRNVPFQLNAAGTGTFSWLPPDGLSNSSVANPIASLQDDQVYELTTTTTEGCIARDTLSVKVFKGSAVYVPNAFTPNNDGRNDRLKPMYVAIKKLDFFTIFNRWGEKVFSTTNLQAGWDGNLRGKKALPGAYVWMIRATDIVGQVYNLKGTFVLIQ